MAAFGSWFQKKTESPNRYSEQLKELRRKIPTEDRQRFRRLREDGGAWLNSEDRRQAQLMSKREIEAWLAMKPAEREAWFERVETYLLEKDASWQRWQNEESRPSEELDDVGERVDELRKAAELLGVEISADKAEVRRAFRVASKQYHPDLGGDVRKFTEIQHAYDVLMNR